MNEIVGLYVSVPLACFRVPRAREYFETYPLPPPATVFGMLLSLVGETNRRVHETAEIAVALVSEPQHSTVLRTLWRVKNKNEGLGSGNNRRPDFQELLTDIKLAVWIRPGENEQHETALADRVNKTLNDPVRTRRYGGLSLGESTHLVDEVKPLDHSRIKLCKMLLNEEDGDLSLPIWADHVGGKSSWSQFRLADSEIRNSAEIPPNAWTAIRRKGVAFNQSEI